MSDAGTALMGGGFVDEGIEYERMVAEITELHHRIATASPICPVCLKTMRKVNYCGYYDKFSCWMCECDKFEGAAEMTGGYA